MEHYKFFQNRECEYFPCHKGVKEEDFNCIFCYCPLYFTDCGGMGTVLPNGIKDCTDCTLPHGRCSHDYITGRIREINRKIKSEHSVQ